MKINSENVPEGTIIRAIINGQVVATTQAILFQGQTVYDIDVPADDPNTAIVEGGQEGDTIRFMLAGFLVRETATWYSGTDTEFNLSLTSNATLPPPQPTETPLPTQTAVILPTPTPTNLPTGDAITQPTQTPVTEPGPASTATLPSTPTTSGLALETEDALAPIEGTEAPGPTVTDVDQPTAQAENETQTEIHEESRGMGIVLPTLILSGFGAVGAVVFWVIRKKRKEDSGLLL